MSFGGLQPDYRLGSSVDSRQPPERSSIFDVDPEAPGGLGVVEADFTTEAAGVFEPER